MKTNMFPGALLLLTLVSGIFISCSKDDDDIPAPSIVGLWKGKYGTSTNYPSMGYAFLFRSNGTVRVFDGTDTSTATKAEGTYTVTGTTVNTTYTYLGSGPTYSTTGTINAPNFTFYEGTYGSGTNTTNGGRFFAVKE